MPIKINNYELLNFEPDTLLLTKSGITKLNDTPIKSLLSELATLKNQSIAEPQLDTIIANHFDTPRIALDFLLDTVTIQRAAKAPYYRQANLYFDTEPISQAKGIFSDSINLETCSFDEHNVAPKNERKLFILATFDLHPSNARDFYFKFCTKNPESAIIPGYFIEGKYHLSQPFIPAIGNPCAFCAIDRIRNAEKLRPGMCQCLRMNP